MADVTQPPQGPDDCSRAVLDLAHRWLASPGAGPATLPGLLGELVAAFQAEAAGLASLADGKPVVRECVGGSVPFPLPWAGDADLLARLQRSVTALVVPTDGERSLLATAVRAGDGSGWLLWLDRPAGPSGAWRETDAAALVVTAQLLARHLETADAVAGWVRQLEHAARQRRLMEAASVTAKLAHDYGNVLTPISGFAELSLSLLPVGSPVQRYLEEVHRGAQQGALLTQRLRLFARRPPPGTASTSLDGAVAQVRKRAVGWGAGVELRVDVPSALPAVALGADVLHEVLGALLDNAREAVESKGCVTLSVRIAPLSAEECLGLWGDADPGEHVCVEVTDTGPGLSAEARERVLREPFYTSKLRHRGLGLPSVFGLLHAHKGGFRLDMAPGGGVAARVYLPVAEVPAEVPQHRPSPAGRGLAAVRTVQSSPH